MLLLMRVVCDVRLGLVSGQEDGGPQYGTAIFLYVLYKSVA